MEFFIPSNVHMQDTGTQTIFVKKSAKNVLILES